MKQIINSLLALSLFFNSVVAQAEIKYLEKGNVAPYTGYLFTPDHEKRYRLIDQELEYYKKTSQLNEDLNKLFESKVKVMDDRILIRDQQIDTLSKRLTESKEGEFFTKLGFFILGALVTTGVAFGVSRAIR